ncbi:MAG: RNA polymerase sigma factor [Deltaproteobacteria bacterium]|nr:RNA polymerase sigma factor [Deltaproteobacteria bacterium]
MNSLDAAQEGSGDGNVAPAQTPSVDGVAHLSEHSTGPSTEPAAASAAASAPDFTTVYRAHFAYVITALRRLGARDADLPDLAHDVFVVVHRKLAAFDHERPLKPWLFGIAYRTMLDRKRRHASFRESLHDDVGEHAASATPAPDALLAAREAHALVLRALGALSDEQRAVFVMHELEGMTMPEIAMAIGAPLNTLYSRLRLARDAFATTVRALAAPPRARAGGTP